jgi:hypothetical protein
MAFSEKTTHAPFGFTIFCDDIRQEVGGKATLVGCFQGNLHFISATFPVTLPKLCLAIHYFEPASLPAERVSLSISLPGDPPDKPTAAGEIPFETLAPAPDALNPDGHLLKQSILHFVMALVTIKSPGFISVRARRGEETIRLGSLQISVGPLPSEG